MRVQIHDFGGYAFIGDLTEHLASLGHEVDHVYSDQYSSNVGDFVHRFRDLSSVTVTPLRATAPAEKYSPVGRLRFETSYAMAWRKLLRDRAPEVVVTANMPLITLALGTIAMRTSGIRRVQWHQDVVSLAMGEELRRMLPPQLARIGVRVLDCVEASATRRATAVVAISDAFRSVYRRWRVAPDKISVVRNWAPLAQISPRGRENEFSQEQGLADRPRVVYAGTLGRKHRPELLTEFASAMSERGRPVDLVVVSEGDAAVALQQTHVRDSSVRVVPFQPAARLPNVLGSADALIVLLEPGAATFSVPSKVATYLAAGRPVIGLMADGNAAATDILGSGGFVAGPNRAGAEAAADWFDAILRDGRDEVLASRARAYAEQHFDAASALDRLTAVIVGDEPRTATVR